MRLFFNRYLLTGFVFQSAIIAGAYGSGAELMEFFFPYGPLGGVLAILVVMVALSVVVVVGLEFARKFKLYDYRSLMKKLLGRGWIAFEILYVLLMILVLSVIGAAAGAVVEEILGLNRSWGTAVMMAFVGLLTFYGTPTIERFLAIWSFVLYAAYIGFFAIHFAQFGGDITDNIVNYTVLEGWIGGGLHYTGLIISIVPVLAFVVRHLETRRHAVWSGVLAGPIVMFPGLLFYLAMIGQYDALLAGTGEIPLTVLLGVMAGSGIFAIIFPIVLFGTFIESGAAFIHGFNERIATAMEEKGHKLTHRMRAMLAFGLLVIAVVLAEKVGLTALIAQGYSTIAVGFILIYGLPLLTYGAWLAFKSQGQD
jgi:uncharacterized membrane protein YkvI